MKKIITGVSALAVLALSTMSAHSQMSKEDMMKMMQPMLGKWGWQGFVIENKACDTNPAKTGMCATVISGPKNVGLEMIRSPMMPKDGKFVGKVAHPATGLIYNAQMGMSADMNTWTMKGCTDSGACAEGAFTRMQ